MPSPTQDDRDRRDAGAEFVRKRLQAAEKFRGEEGGILSPRGGSSPVHSDDDDDSGDAYGGGGGDEDFDE